MDNKNKPRKTPDPRAKKKKEKKLANGKSPFYGSRLGGKEKVLVI